jgi:hypothetical protein
MGSFAICFCVPSKVLIRRGFAEIPHERDLDGT